MRWITLLATASMLAGCSTYSLKELRHTTPQGTPFQNALAKLYMGFAIEEEKNYDWFDSMYFADKGLRSAYGKDVEPEELRGWDIPSEQRATMQKAREVLVKLLSPQVKRDYPLLAARALFYFDCWVEQQEENWQEEEIASCRDGLADAFERLKAPDINLVPMVDPEASYPVMPQDEQDAAPEPVVLPPEQDRVQDDQEEEYSGTPEASAVTPLTTVEERIARGTTDRAAESAEGLSPFAAPEGVETSSYMVFFDNNHTDLPEGSRKVVDEIVRALAGISDYSVVIGANEHVELAQERAEEVKKRLVEGGINAQAVTISVAQVPDFMAESGEGDSSPIRHRVEIYLNQ